VLDPHWLQLRPRCDVTQSLRQFVLDIDPAPQQVTENIDLDGNAVIKVRFRDSETTQLVVRASSEVETFRTNPFDYLLESWAATLPIDYPAALWQQLQPYLGGQFTGGIHPSLDPTATQLAQEIWLETSGNLVSFLTELNQRIQQSCTYSLRQTENTFPPGITWNQRLGSCRDYAVLFMEVCRAAGIASRFVSGYQEGDPDNQDRHLHAWAEVYLPGAGWRGYDPTNAIAIADRHIALVATPTARNSAPVIGTRKTLGVKSEMHYDLKIEPQS
jgi:transglutaminase-like putative cysteine protease